MQVVDEEGRLFGRVNVIDAFVVAIVLTGLLVSGLVLLGVPGADNVGSGDPSDGKAGDNRPVRYVTLVTNPEDTAIASLVESGDRSGTGDPYAIEITDVYHSPVDNGVRLYVRARISGTTTTSGSTTKFWYRDSVIRTKSRILFYGDEYTFNGSILRVDRSGGRLSIQNTSVVVRSTISNNLATQIRVDDEFSIVGGKLGRVERIARYPMAEYGTQRVELGVVLRTIDRPEGTWFAGRRVEIGQIIPLRADRYGITGKIVHRGDTTPPGEQTTRTVRVRLDNVTESVASNLDRGMATGSSGGDRASITDLTTEPASVILRSDAGQIYSRDHPTRKDVVVTLEMNVRRSNGELYFQDQRLLENSKVVLDFGDLKVSPEVTEIGS